MIVIGYQLKWLWLVVCKNDFDWLAVEMIVIGCVWEGSAVRRLERAGVQKQKQLRAAPESIQHQYSSTVAQCPSTIVFLKNMSFLLILYCLVGTYFPLYTVSFLVHSACPLSIGFFSMTNSSFESGTATWAVWCATNDHYFFFCIIIFYALSIYVWYAFNFKLGFPPKIPC